MVKSTYLITGITGYIGSLIAKKVMQSDEYTHEKVHIYAFVRDIKKAQDILKNYNCKHLTLIEMDICSNEYISVMLDKSIDYIIHCAATTQSFQMVSNPVETADGIVLGTRNMLELAHLLHVKSMVYLSSMEVYGCVSDIGRNRKEDELGHILLESARSCYSLGKRMAEHYCHIYQQQYNVPVKIARLAQTFGRGVNLEDNRVYMQFARAVVEERDIVLYTQGLSMGNYCDSDDVVNAIFTILKKGVSGETYNVSNEENTMCIRKMAELVAHQIAKDKIKVRTELKDIEKIGYAPETNLRISSEKLCRLGWKPTKGLVKMYEDVISEIRENNIRKTE